MLRVDIILGSTRLGRNGEDQYPIDFWVFNTGLSIKLALRPPTLSIPLYKLCLHENLLIS